MERKLYFSASEAKSLGEFESVFIACVRQKSLVNANEDIRLVRGVQADVEDRRAVREPPDRDEIDAGLGD